jgi:prepilin-type N-terminal cleavage/methylation domain-containing protein/prepilin-type processing-associated H-X9-DG protein
MAMKAKLPSRASGFTLLELLVVIAILGILAALGLSVASSSMKKGQTTKCLASLQQIGIAIRLYVGENDGRLPDIGHVRAEDGTSLSWINTLSRYLGPKFIGRCPSNTASPWATVTYGWNDLLVETDGSGIPVTRCETPASTLAVAESADTYTSDHFHFAGSRSRITLNQFKSFVGVERHPQGANYLFVDGHVETLASNEVKARLDATSTKFIIP